MTWHQNLRHAKEYVLSFFKWLALGTALGILGGLVGTAFHFALDWATEFRESHDIVLWFLPLAGLPIVGLYRLCHMEKNSGTNEIIDDFNTRTDVNPFLAPLIFISTFLTHLFGGSAGREGAAMQLGGAIGSGFGRILRLSKEDRRVLVVSGMGAVFAALFGTPVTACLFTLEFMAVGTIFDPGLLPCFAASFIASRVALAFHVPPTAFDLPYILPLGPANVLRVAVLAILTALVSLLFCYVMHHTERLLRTWIPNPFLRIAAGGAAVTALTLLLGTRDYNGAGMHMVLRALGGEIVPWAFLLKILFTAITLGAGFKGGEIVPTFFIGAAFGCTAAGVLGLDPGFGAALGLVGLFCCVTNSPIASLVLSVEMFGGGNLAAFAIMCAAGFVLSGNSGLYTSQTLIYSKVRPDTVNRKVGGE